MQRALAEIVRSPILLERLSVFVSDGSFGAQAFFAGVVRKENEGRAVEAVTYDGYEPLASRALREIVEEAARRCGGKAAAVHRLGRLAVGDTSVAVAAASPHRAEAFEACSWMIEEIKRRLPVWKKEHYAGGRTEWLEGSELESVKLI